MKVSAFNSRSIHKEIPQNQNYELCEKWSIACKSGSDWNTCTVASGERS